MKIKDIIKKQTTVIAIAVVVVTLAVIGVSYAIFFDVKTNRNNQVIEAGSLKLTISDVSALAPTEPMSTSAGLTSTPATYTVKNTESNLPASYSIYVYAGTNNTIDLSKIKISTDGTNAKVVSSITDKFTESGTTYFKIDSGVLAAKASSATKNLRLWVDESLLTDELSSAKLDMNLYVISEVQE